MDSHTPEKDSKDSKKETTSSNTPQTQQQQTAPLTSDIPIQPEKTDEDKEEEAKSATQEDSVKAAELAKALSAKKQDEVKKKPEEKKKKKEHYGEYQWIVDMVQEGYAKSHRVTQKIGQLTQEKDSLIKTKDELLDKLAKPMTDDKTRETAQQSLDQTKEKLAAVEHNLKRYGGAKALLSWAKKEIQDSWQEWKEKPSVQKASSAIKTLAEKLKAKWQSTEDKSDNSIALGVKEISKAADEQESIELESISKKETHEQDATPEENIVPEEKGPTRELASDHFKDIKPEERTFPEPKELRVRPLEGQSMDLLIAEAQKFSLGESAQKHGWDFVKDKEELVIHSSQTNLNSFQERALEQNLIAHPEVPTKTMGLDSPAPM